MRYAPCLLLCVGCAHALVGSDDLTLRRVVIYRNGVAYFERAGRVKAEAVKFRVKTDHVGDFLATLAVMEEGGSSVRSAAFPLHLAGSSDEPKDAKIKDGL